MIDLTDDCTQIESWMKVSIASDTKRSQMSKCKIKSSSALGRYTSLVSWFALTFGWLPRVSRLSPDLLITAVLKCVSLNWHSTYPYQHT